MWQSYLKVEEKEHPLFCNKGIFNLKERESLLCEVRLLHSLYSISPTRRLITKESAKETNATRVISQPQMLDKLKEAESLLDDIQEGLEWLFGEEKTILSKVNSPFHLSADSVGVKCVYINTSEVHFLLFFGFFLSVQQWSLRNPFWDKGSTPRPTTPKEMLWRNCQAHF